MLTTLALVVAGLLLLLIAALAAPVTVTVEVHGGDRLEGAAQVRALYGLVRQDLSRGAGRQRPAARPRARRRRRSGPSLRAGLAAMRSPGLARAFTRLLGRLWRGVRVRTLEGHVRAGLDDPADTGVAWGVLAPVTIATAQRFPGFRAEPAFEGACLDVDARGSVSAVPLEVLLAALAFALSPATLRAAFALWRAR